MTTYSGMGRRSGALSETRGKGDRICAYRVLRVRGVRPARPEGCHEEEGIPFHTLVTEYQTLSFSHVRTRLQAFFESLRGETL